MVKVKERREYMSNADQIAMAGLARTHVNCQEKTGKQRPGKTAQDKVRKRRAGKLEE